MDLTASIRLKIDLLRSAKTARFNALSTAIERDVALLTQQSAELFTKLEDALEADVLKNPEDLETLQNAKEIEKDKEVLGEEDEGEVLSYHSSVNEKQSETVPQVGRRVVDEEVTRQDRFIKELEEKYPQLCHQQASRSPSVAVKKQDEALPAIPQVPISESTSISKSPESLVSDLRSRAGETQTLLAEKHISLTNLRTKHEIAMKRLDKLQADLEKVSQKWEAEERERIQSESTSALGKRKREDSDEEPSKSWRALGLKGVEWSVLFGIGVASAIGISKFQQ
jgi:hypothetical protein